MMDNHIMMVHATLCGGGRYNGLLELLDGPSETGIGFALSIDSYCLHLKKKVSN